MSVTLSLLRVSLRDYKRLAMLLVGVVLTVSLFAGINVSADAAGRRALRKAIDEVYVDMNIYQSMRRLEWLEGSQLISGLQDIQHVETVIRFRLQGYNMSSNEANISAVHSLGDYRILGLADDFPTRYNVTLEGNWNLTSGVMVTKDLSTELHVDVGDWIRIITGTKPVGGEVSPYWASVELKVEGIATLGSQALSVLQLPPEGVEDWDIASAAFRPPHYLILMSRENLFSIAQDFSDYTGENVELHLSTFHQVFVDRGEVVHFWDPDATVKALDDIEKRIWTVTSVYAVSTENYLKSTITGRHWYWAQRAKITFGALSLPVFLLCLYLTMTSSFLVATDKRREIGLLKVRGASSKKIFWSLVLNALVTGLIGSAVGLLAGLGTGAVITGFMMEGNITDFFAPHLMTFETAAMGIGLGCLISILAALRPARMASHLHPIEATREYLEVEAEAARPWKPKWTLVPLGLGAFKMGELIVGFNPREAVTYAPSLLGILVNVYISISDVLSFIGPLLFIYGVTKVLTRSQTRLYRTASLLMRKPLGDVSEIVSRNLARNPARASRITLLIALTISFGFLATTAGASEWDSHLRTEKTKIGSDINVLLGHPWSSALPPVDEGFAKNLSRIDGVAKVTPVIYGVSPTGRGFHGINVTDFREIVYFEEDFTEGITMTQALQAMEETPQGVLIDMPVKRIRKLEVGEVFSFDGTSMEVLGVVRTMPGLGHLEDGRVVANLQYLRQNNLTSDLRINFVVKLEAGADPSLVAGAIKASHPKIHKYNIATLAEAQALLGEDPVLFAVYSFVKLEFVYTLIASSVGLGLIALIGIRERMPEIGVLRARGTNRWQVLKIFFGESFSVLIIAALVGMFTGVIAARGTLALLDVMDPLYYYGKPIRRLIVPTDVWILLSLGAAVFLLASLIPAWWASRKTVVEMIRFR